MTKPKLLLTISLLSGFLSSLMAQKNYDRSQLAVFFQNQEYEQAINYLQSVEAGDTNMQYKADLGYAYFMDEQYNESKNQFLALYQQQPVNKQANIYLGQLYSMFKKPDSALLYYLNLTQIQPANYRYWQRSAQLFTEMSKPDSALVFIRQSYQLNPKAGKVLVQYVNLLIRQKQSGKVDSLLNQFLTNDSSNQDVVIKRVDFSFKKPDYSNTIFWAERLLRDSADVVMPFVNLAYSYLNVDSIDKCIALCEWMIVENKASEPLLYCAALAFAKKKNYTKSNELLDECLKLSIQKSAVTYFNAKSDNYEEMKQYQQSIRYYDTSYYMFQSPTDLYYTGRIYDKYLKNKAKAVYYYKQFLAKRKTPLNSGELQIFNYIKEYIKPQ